MLDAAVSEAVRNSMLHAGADAARHVSIRADVDSLTVDVLDDGCGFDPGAVPRTASGWRSASSGAYARSKTRIGAGRVPARRGHRGPSGLVGAAMIGQRLGVPAGEYPVDTAAGGNVRGLLGMTTGRRG